jgi:hypothetical protein
MANASQSQIAKLAAIMKHGNQAIITRENKIPQSK